MTEAEPPTNSLRHWREQLLHRKYLQWVRPTADREYSVRIECAGASAFFPLGTADAAKAAARARRIYRTIEARGWNAAGRLYPREFTLAIFWSENPIACTYTTLLTATERLAAPKRSGKPRAEGVAILEGDEGMRRALGHWLETLPACCRLGEFATVRELLKAVNVDKLKLLLFNCNLPSEPAFEWRAAVQQAAPGLLTLGFGTYKESDDIFVSLTGVSGGYFLRRRPPLEMLDPLRDAWSQPARNLEETLFHVRRYFQNLFGRTPLPEAALDAAELTPREHEILVRLGKGFGDKQIADELNISAWTVHNHMKNIFKKLGVHTRTQAVLKYVQK